MTACSLKDADCPVCNATGPETFRYWSERYIFDVDQAREFANDGREPVEMADDDVRFSLKRCHLEKSHVAHVDISYPGIIACVWHTNPDGETVCGQRLIDGHHRAARCLQLGHPFLAVLLTEAESRAIVRRSPPARELSGEFSQRV